MSRLVALLSLAFLPACMQLGLPKDAEPGSDSGGAAGSSGASAGGGAPTTGADCGVDPSSGIALCLGISRCPTVRVDPDQFPECGYRISGNLIDLECLCGDALCPIGSATTCVDAKALLSEQSAQSVCAGIADDQCQVIKRNSANSKSTCDSACRAECSGVPGCLAFCGC